MRIMDYLILKLMCFISIDCLEIYYGTEIVAIYVPICNTFSLAQVRNF